MEALVSKPDSELPPELLTERQVLHEAMDPLYRLISVPMSSTPPKLRPLKRHVEATLGPSRGAGEVRRRIGKFLRDNGEPEWPFDDGNLASMWDGNNFKETCDNQDDRIFDLKLRKPDVCAQLLKLLDEERNARSKEPNA